MSRGGEEDDHAKCTLVSVYLRLPHSLTEDKYVLQYCTQRVKLLQVIKQLNGWGQVVTKKVV